MKKFTLLLLVALAFATNTRADVEWTIWEGTATGANVQLNAVNFTDISEGDILYIYATGTLNKGLAKQTGEGWTWESVSDYTPIETDINTNYYYKLNSGFVTLLTGGDFKALNITNDNASGTISKVTIKKGQSMIKYVLSTDEKSFGQWYETEEKTYTCDLPTSVAENDFIYLPATKETGTYDDRWDESKKGETIGWWEVVFADNVVDASRTWNYNPKNFEHDTWQKIASTEVSKINDGKTICAKGLFYNATGLYLYHPITSFAIGSIGYATFSADQEVTAPANVTAYKATVNGDYVALTPFTDNVIPANTGAIIAGDQGAVLEFTASATGSEETSALFANTSATTVSSLAEDGYDLYVLYPGSAESETDIDLSTLLSEISDWGGKVTVSTTEPYTAEWTNNSTSSSMGKWLGSDWSSYDKLRLVFTSNTVTETVHFGLSYNGQLDSENTGADLATGELTVDIPLNESYKGAMGNFSFNSNATSGSLTFKSAALIDNDGATVAEFRKTTSGTLAANKAYLKISQSDGVTPARALKVVFGGDEITEINSVEEKKPVTINDDVIYNLNGQVVKNPSRGIYIKNGKKFIVE